MTADVTVVIPAWGPHARLYLEDAVRSLELEVPIDRVMIVDNASSVDVSVTGTRHVRLDRRVTVGRCRTRALAHVDTPYVMFWDADDVILPGTIRALRDALAADDGAVAAVAPIFEDDLSDHGWPRRRLRWLFATAWPFALAQSMTALFPTTGATVIRTDALRAGGGFADTNAGDDWVAAVSLALRGRVLSVDVGGRIYRRHPDELSVSWDRRDLADAARLVRDRLRHDAAGRRLRPLLPAIWLGQLLVADVARPLRRRFRPRLRERDRAQEPRLDVDGSPTLPAHVRP